MVTKCFWMEKCPRRRSMELKKRRPKGFRCWIVAKAAWWVWFWIPNIVFVSTTPLYSFDGEKCFFFCDDIHCYKMNPWVIEYYLKYIITSDKRAASLILEIIINDKTSTSLILGMLLEDTAFIHVYYELFSFEDVIWRQFCVYNESNKEVYGRSDSQSCGSISRQLRRRFSTVFIDPSTTTVSSIEYYQS